MPIKIVKAKVKKRDLQIFAKHTRPHKAKFKTLTSIGPEKLALVESRMLHGETMDSVAKVIKQDWKLLPKITLASLSSILTKYRAERVAPKLMLLADPKALVLSQFADEVNVLDNLTRLVEIQQGRVSKALHLEKPVGGFLHPELRFEMMALAGMYKQLSDLQMDLGLLYKVPKLIQIESAAARSGQLLKEQMQRSERVESALTKAFAILDGKFSVVPDGKTQSKH